MGMNKKNEIDKNLGFRGKNLEKLKKDFPQCFDKNGNFDLEKFKREISENNEINFSSESYSLDWLGKSYAKVLTTDKRTTFLKEDEKWNKKEENKKSENLLIKGDNLEVLKHLVGAYNEEVKMIYIDPPYNTGSDGFVYEDDRKFSPKMLSELAGIDEEKAERILEFTRSKSNSHSAWLTFMYPRLYIAKQLLKDEGVIFVSIDDNEVAQLRLLMDEIFGEENFVGELIWLKKNAQNDADNIEKNHEYILVYRKTDNVLIFQKTEEIKEVFKDKNNLFYYIGAGITTGGAGGVLNARPNLGYTIYFNDKTKDFFAVDDYDKELAKISNNENEIYKTRQYLIKKGYTVIRPPKKGVGLGRWTWALDKFNNEKNKILIKKTKTGYSVFKKEFIEENKVYKENNKFFTKIIRNKPFKSFIDNISSSLGIKELNQLFDRKIFENPKNTSLLKKYIKEIVKNNDLILDFFAGSGTTGDAVMQLNSEDGGKRKYILVQLPEEIDKNKNKTAYDFVKNELGVENPTIFDITKERLVRAGKKILKENEEQKNPKDFSAMDFGFKVFETEKIPENFEFEAEEQNKENKLFDYSSLKEKDLENLALTWKTEDGVLLTKDFQEIDFEGYKGFYVGGKLYLLFRGFEIKHLENILKKIEEDKKFNPNVVYIFGPNFESARIKEFSDNITNFNNKKSLEIDFIVRNK